jgi:hypothetical protein
MDYIVYADSNNRNQSMFPNSNNFTLYLTNPIKNITKVELLTAMLPGMNTSQFITLDILELRTPNNLTADQLVMTNTSSNANIRNLMVPTANAFYGSFATIPVKVQGSDEFYNANYRVANVYPSRIDKLDRLTITWRQPNNGSVFYDPTGMDLGRNMFLLRFETMVVPIEPERPVSLPDPVQWDGANGPRTKVYVLLAIAVTGLLIIISIKNRKRHV